MAYNSMSLQFILMPKWLFRSLGINSDLLLYPFMTLVFTNFILGVGGCDQWQSTCICVVLASISDTEKKKSSF